MITPEQEEAVSDLLDALQTHIEERYGMVIIPDAPDLDHHAIVTIAGKLDAFIRAGAYRAHPVNCVCGKCK